MAEANKTSNQNDELSILSLKGIVPKPRKPVSIEEMNAAIAEQASARFIKESKRVSHSVDENTLMPSSNQLRICVFCGSANGADSAYVQAAKELGRSIAGSGMGLVYGGAIVGLMGVLADAALEGGAEVIGVMPDVLMDREIAHHGLTKLHIVKTMHERKALMADHADAFIALPGGYGTLDEFIEIVTWAQLKIHQKPCVLLNISGYYDGFLAFLNHGVTQGFIKPENYSLIQIADNVESALELVLCHKKHAATGKPAVEVA